MQCAFGQSLSCSYWEHKKAAPTRCCEPNVQPSRLQKLIPAQLPEPLSQLGHSICEPRTIHIRAIPHRSIKRRSGRCEKTRRRNPRWFIPTRFGCVYFRHGPHFIPGNCGGRCRSGSAIGGYASVHGVVSALLSRFQGRPRPVEDQDPPYIIFVVLTDDLKELHALHLIRHSHASEAFCKAIVQDRAQMSFLCAIFLAILASRPCSHPRRSLLKFFPVTFLVTRTASLLVRAVPCRPQFLFHGNSRGGSITAGKLYIVVISIQMSYCQQPQLLHLVCRKYPTCPGSIIGYIKIYTCPIRTVVCQHVFLSAQFGAVLRKHVRTLDL